MSAHRFFLTAPLPTGEGALAVPLSSRDRRHFVKVLRTSPGDEFVAVEPDGYVWRMRATTVSDDAVEAERIERIDARPPYRVTLVQGMAKGGKVDLVLEKATELNIEAVVPVLTERSVVRLDPERRRARGERLRRVALAAAKQSHRASIPQVSDPVAFEEVAASLEPFDVTLVVWEEASATGPGIGQALDESGATAASRIALFVGPEGGLTSEEVYALESQGARAVTLGETVLRSETAGIVATALCVYELGGLGGRPRG